jgi:Skp family chaperone for outer membrane proteins
MNELKNVTNKLFKTELASKKLELGLIQDIQSDFNFVSKNFGDIYDKFWNSIETSKNLQSLLKTDLDKYSKIEKDIISAKQKLQDLGLESQSKELDVILTKASKNKSDITRVLSVKF